MLQISTILHIDYSGNFMGFLVQSNIKVVPIPVFSRCRKHSQNYFITTGNHSCIRAGKAPGFHRQTNVPMLHGRLLDHRLFDQQHLFLALRNQGQVAFPHSIGNRQFVIPFLGIILQDTASVGLNPFMPSYRNISLEKITCGQDDFLTAPTDSVSAVIQSKGKRLVTYRKHSGQRSRHPIGCQKIPCFQINHIQTVASSCNRYRFPEKHKRVHILAFQVSIKLGWSGHLPLQSSCGPVQLQYRGRLAQICGFQGDQQRIFPEDHIGNIADLFRFLGILCNNRSCIQVYNIAVHVYRPVLSILLKICTGEILPVL